MKLRNKKTGEIEEWSFIVFKAISPNSKLDKCFSSISQLNEEWEDYKTKEPLIKDEKIRKTVRAWAEVNAIKRVVYVHDSTSCRLTDVREEDYCIDFEGFIPTLKYGEGIYSIVELCGKEEE